MQNLQTLQQRWVTSRSFVQASLRFVNQPRYYWLTRPLGAFIVTRLIVFLGAYFAEIILPSATGDGLYHVNPNNIFLDVWARWDSGFYLGIAQAGYWFKPGFQSSVAFFPLYPLLMNLMSHITGDTLSAGVLVSNLCFLGALIFLYRLTHLEFGDESTATRAVFYIAAFPTAFFFSAVYTESTFLLFSIGAMYFARKQEWGWAALMGLLCSASRIVGFVMWGVVGLEWLRANGWTLLSFYRREAWQNVLKAIREDYVSLLIICLIPLGILSYMFFLNTTYDDPVAFNTTQSAWGRQNLGPIAVVSRDLSGLLKGDFKTGQIWYHVIFDLSAFFAVMATCAVMWRRLGESYTVYSLICMLIPISSGSGSLSRYTLVVFPFFMMLAYWGRRPLIDRAILIGSSVFLGILTAGFVNWVFIA